MKRLGVFYFLKINKAPLSPLQILSLLLKSVISFHSFCSLLISFLAKNIYERPYAIFYPEYVDLMTKSYWLKKISIPNTDLFLEYIRTVLPWIKSVGGVIVKRDLIQKSNSNEWDGGQLGLVIEFESKFAAKKAFYSEVFQKYLYSRGLMELVTISTL